MLRFVQIANIPVLIDGDEGRLGAWARKIWIAPDFPDLFGFGWNSFPNIGYTVQYALTPIFGIDFAALRWSSAVIGVLSIVVTYAWVRCWWGSVVALVAAAFLSLNPEHLYWSRVGYNNIHCALLASMILLAFARAMRDRRAKDYVLLGMSLGLGWHTYHAAKVYAVLLAIPFTLIALARPVLWRAHRRGVALTAIAAVMMVLPQLPNIYSGWHQIYEDVSNRGQLELLFNAYSNGATEAVRRFLYTHIADSFHVFISVPAGLAIFEPFGSVAFFLGLTWMVWHWREPRHTFTLAWVFGLLISGSMLTDWPPSKPRLVGLLPAVCTVAAIVVVRLARVVRSALPGQGLDLSILAVLLWLTG
ncbi:MAG TPA: glycosyltransferase family 39 protein, partial [Terriglobales bacterium]|nr:glycosyltransferase family 39 protein [Terriglobales bacterium]